MILLLLRKMQSPYTLRRSLTTIMAIKMYEVQPDYMTTPGEILRDTIRSKNLTQEQAAEDLGTSAKTLSNIINNKVSITPEMALKLEYVLETPASFWNNLAKNYQEYQLRIHYKWHI